MTWLMGILNICLEAFDKVFRDKAFSIAKNPKYNGYQRSLASIAYNFLNKKTALLADESASGGAVKNQNMSIQRHLDLAWVANVSDDARESVEQ